MDTRSTGTELRLCNRTIRLLDIMTICDAKFDVLLEAAGPFGQRFGKRPELPDRHFEVTANREHDVTGNVCLTTFYPAQIIVAIPQRGRQTGL